MKQFDNNEKFVNTMRGICDNFKVIAVHVHLTYSAATLVTVILLMALCDVCSFNLMMM